MSRTKKKDEHISSPSPSAQITVPLDEFQQHLEFFRSVCQFLQKISKDYSPIQVLDALNGQAVTSLCAARCVLRAREKESICFDDLVEIIQRQECDSQFDGETIAYKLAVIDRMENPYLVFDQQVGKKRLVSTQRATEELFFLQGIANEVPQQAILCDLAEHPLTQFEKVLESLPKSAKNFIPILRALAKWMYGENSATDFYSKIRNLYSYSVTNLPTFRLLGLIPPEGASWGKLHDSTKRANISVPHTDFTTWFSVKLAGLVFMRTVEQKGDLYFLTDYGRESLEQLALTSSGNSLSAQSRFGRGLERPSSQREFFQEAWAFLQKQCAGTEHAPIDLLDVLDSQVVTSRSGATIVCSVMEATEQGKKITPSDLEEAIINARTVDDNKIDIVRDRQRTRSKLQWLLGLEHPYLRIDEHGYLFHTGRAEHETAYLHGMARIYREQEPQLEDFEPVIDGIPAPYRQMAREFAEWIVFERKHSLYDAIHTLYAASVMSKKSLQILHLVAARQLTLRELKEETKTLGLCPYPPDRNPDEYFDEWFTVKYDGLIRVEAVKPCADRGLWAEDTFCITEKGLNILNCLGPPMSRKRHVTGGAELDKVRKPNLFQEPKLEKPPKDELVAALYTLFASLRPEQQEKFLNAVAWTKPIELNQEQAASGPQRPNASESLSEISWVGKVNGPEPKAMMLAPAAPGLPENPGVLEIMQWAHGAVSNSVKSVTKENIYDLVRCINLKNRIGDEIDGQLRALLDVNPAQKMTVKPSTNINHKTGQPAEIAYIKIEGGGLPERKETLASDVKIGRKK